jgi:hypothetical protein
MGQTFSAGQSSSALMDMMRGIFSLSSGWMMVIQVFP